MATGVQVWSQTPVTNATVDTNINWAEGMAPSQIDDSARAMMASAAKWRDDNNGTLVTSGTTTAFTVTSNQVAAANTAGYTIKVQFNATNDTSATLAVDGNAAAPMQIVAGTNVPYGAFAAGSIQSFTYSSTGTGQWIVSANAPVRAVSSATPGNPSGTTSSAPKMMGLGSSCALTPKATGRCLILFQFYCQAQTSAGTNVGTQIYYGTGSAPVNGAAATGTAAGIAQLIASNFNNEPYAVTLQALVTGLTIGTAYWMDIGLANGQANGAAVTISQINFSVVEI